MTTITQHRRGALPLGAGQSTREWARSTIITALLLLVSVLVVDRHAVAMPDATVATIGVAAAVLADAGSSQTSAAEKATIRHRHELARCYREAHRLGQDPATCRLSR